VTESPSRDLAERLFDFACDVVTYCRELSKEPGVVRHLAWQLSDAGTSAAANYQEAKAAYSRRDFAARNTIVLKELRESKLWIRIVVRCQLGSLAGAQRIENEADQLCAIFTSSMKKLHPVENSRT
jgi:four helix bundle protein